MLKKSRTAFFAVLTAAVIVASAAAVFLRLFSALILLTAFTVWWTLYFRSLEYETSDNTLTIKSGFVFGKIRKIPLSSVLRTTVILIPNNKPVASIIHTAGGNALIFAEFKIN